MIICSIAVVTVYIPSKSEEAWYGEVTGNICKIASNTEQVHQMRHALKWDSLYMSKMDDKSLIEPLTGIGRHPFAEVGCQSVYQTTSIFDISYLKIADYCNKPPPRRSYFFDMGCSMYDETKAIAAGLSSSIPLFENMYTNSCISFDKVIGWEARPYPHWWKKVPTHKRNHIEFINHKVDADQIRARLTEVDQLDFVVIKLDIDLTETEIKILNVLEENAHLVDELFFEYHYYFDGLNFGWGKNDHIMKNHNATSAIQLFSRLRKKGTRAHFWI